jgi:type VI secretion system secreted protein Hcp
MSDRLFQLEQELVQCRQSGRRNGIGMEEPLALPMALITPTTGVTNVTHVYLKVSDVQGPETRKGLEGSIPILAVDHLIDAVAERLASRPKYQMFKVTKALDKTSPLLYQLLTNNRVIPECELQFWSITSLGAKHLYTIKLKQAFIKVIKLLTLDDLRTSPIKGLPVEEVSFSYKEIGWIWVENGVMAEAIVSAE